MSSEEKPRKDPEKQKPSNDKEQLTDEQLDQVSGGVEEGAKSFNEQQRKRVQ